MLKRWILGFLLIILGAMIFFYPDYAADMTKRKQTEAIQNFQKESMQDNLQEDGGDKNPPVWPGTLLTQCLAYNETLAQTGQEIFQSASVVEEVPSFIPQPEEAFGILTIPAMECRLPLYLGASTKHLNLGAAVLGGTSLPVGGTNANSVIAAHRGWKAGKYFKDIEKLQVGDKVFLTTPWETLIYEVESCEVILPTDSDRLKIQTGKDMLTLLTCHPYRSHGRYRYAVYCVRIEDGTEEQNSGVDDAIRNKVVENPVSSKKDIVWEDRCRKIGTVVIAGCIFMTCIKNRGLKKSRRN